MIRTAPIVSVAALGLALAGCASVSLAASHVQMTTSSAFLKPCKSLGRVTAGFPYISPDHIHTVLRNKAADLGADTVFFDGDDNIAATSWTGEAFICGPNHTLANPGPGPEVATAVKVEAAPAAPPAAATAQAPAASQTVAPAVSP